MVAPDVEKARMRNGSQPNLGRRCSPRAQLGIDDNGVSSARIGTRRSSTVHGPSPPPARSAAGPSRTRSSSRPGEISHVAGCCVATRNLESTARATAPATGSTPPLPMAGWDAAMSPWCRWATAQRAPRILGPAPSVMASGQLMGSPPCPWPGRSANPAPPPLLATTHRRLRSTSSPHDPFRPCRCRFVSRRYRGWSASG